MTAQKKDLSFWAFLRAVGNGIVNIYHSYSKSYRMTKVAVIYISSLILFLLLGNFVHVFLYLGLMPSIFWCAYKAWQIMMEDDC